MENSEDSNTFINDAISQHEVRKVILNAKSRKAVGLDNIPYEVLKNENSVSILTALFNKVFDLGITPSIWKHTIIKPIPKSNMSDPRIPLQYRAISLISTVGKLYSSVINSRLQLFAETNNLYVDEQNGFRKGRSCIDHVHSLSTVIRKRKRKSLSTFVAFVDLEKAFDRIDRNLLYYRLLSYNINGKIYNAIRAMYSFCKCCVNINGWVTDNFVSNYGVKQGDVLSPTLFNFYINDLALKIKEMNMGIDIDGYNLSILLYADDMAIISDSEEHLQGMLDILHEWCYKWRIRVNCKKTNIVHFRPSSKCRTNYQFSIGETELQVVDRYKYLGIVLTEFLDYEITSSTLAEAGSRALGGMINKSKSINGLRYQSYTTMYDKCVTPILDYCSGVWGFKSHPKIDTVQNRAMRYFLGVHKFAPNLAVTGDMGWIPSIIRRKINILRLWNKLVSLDETRLAKHIFLWDYRNPYGCWCNDVRNIFNDIDGLEYYENLLKCDLNGVLNKIVDSYRNRWKTECSKVSKLRTYVRFKTDFGIEPYLLISFKRKVRSYISQFRCGILPLRVETGRFGTHYIPENERLCNFCNSGNIENEYHFVFDCTIYEIYRTELFDNMYNIYPDLNTLNRDEQMKCFMSREGIKIFSHYLSTSYELRQSILYN